MILAERDRLPVGLLEEILEARGYGRAYFAYQHNPEASGGFVDDVKQIEFALAQEEIDRARRLSD